MNPAVKRVLIWAVAFASLLHLAGASGLLLSLLGEVLMVGLILGGFAVMFGLKQAEEVLRAFLLVAIVLVLLPAVIAGILRDLWVSHRGLLTLTALLAGGAWIFFSRSAGTIFLPSLPWRMTARSGSGKAVPIPRRWR